MRFPLRDEEEKSDAFKQGICRDCGANVQSPGVKDRCDGCYEKHLMYAASGYGVDEDVTTNRARSQELGNCPDCGGLLDGSSICSLCEQDPTRKREQARPRQSQRNPYRGVWDEVDQFPQFIFTPSYNEIAKRMMAKSRFFLDKAKRGGPRGREYLLEAASYARIARHMLSEAKKIKELSK